MFKMLYMHVQDAVRARFSVRSYEKREVEPEKLDATLETGRIAPTAANLQPVRVYAAKTPSAVANMSKAACVHGAPVALVVCASTDKAWHRKDGFITAQVDASIATDEMMLMATALGLGTLWICAFDDVAFCAELDIPPKLPLINILAVGYSAAEEPAGRLDARKAMEDFVVPVE